MENLFDTMAEKAGKTIRHWWMFLIIGLLSIIAGIIVFSRPAESYLTLSIMFGVLMLVTGIVELTVSITSNNYFMTRSYRIIGGILDLLIGLFLCIYPGVTLVILPVMLGIWMMFHSFMIIGFGSDMDSMRVKGSGWTVALGVIMLILSLAIVMCPFTIGTAYVVVLSGCAFIVFGIILIILSTRLRRIHEHFRFHDAEVTSGSK